MEPSRKWSNVVLANGAVLVGVAIPHLIDDFLFNIPEEFGLTNIQAQILVGIFAVLLIAIFSYAARGKRAGYWGTACLGMFLSLAGILKHVPLMLKPGPYWSGLFSELLIGILIVSGISLSVTSLLALRALKDGAVEE